MSIDITNVTFGASELKTENPVNAEDVANKAYVDVQTVTVIDNLTTADATKALSANQGKALNASLVTKAPLLTTGLDSTTAIVDDKGIPTAAFVILFNQLVQST